MTTVLSRFRNVLLAVALLFPGISEATTGSYPSPVFTNVRVQGSGGGVTVSPPSSGNWSVALPANSGTLAETNLAQTWTALQTITVANAVQAISSIAPAVSGNSTYNTAATQFGGRHLVATNSYNNAIVGATIQDGANGSGFPTGVTGFGYLNNAGNTVFGLFGRADCYTAGVCTNELNSFNYAGATYSAFPATTSFGTSQILPIALQLASYGNYPSYAGIYAAPTSSGTKGFLLGMYLGAGSANYGFVADATSSAGPGIAGVLNTTGGASTVNLSMQMKGTPVTGSKFISALNSGGSSVFSVDGSGNVTTPGSITAGTATGCATFTSGLLGTTGLPCPSSSAVIPFVANVEGTGIPGIDASSGSSPIMLYESPATIQNALNPTLRLQRVANYTNNYTITAASGNGTTATFSYTGPVIPVGHTIWVTGEQPWGYSGSCVVSASVAGTPSTVSCPNTTTGSQTVSGVFYDQTANGDVNSLFMLSYTSPTASFYEWPFLSSVYDYTGLTLGNNAQQVAVDGTAFKQYQTGVDYTTANFTGTIAGTTMTVSTVTSGVLNPTNRISGGTTASGTYIVQQLTGTYPGGPGTYEVFPSQTATGATTATDVIGYAVGGNFVCEDDTGISNPGGPCVGTEIDNYWVTGSGTDNFGQRGVLQLAWGGLGAGVSTGDHIGEGILFGGADSSIMDNALLFAGNGSYVNIINTDTTTVTGNIIESPNFTLSGSGDVTSYGTHSIGNTGTYALVVSGGVWFGSYSVNQPITIVSLPTCNSTSVGTHATVSNGVAPAAYKTVVGTTGTAVWPVYCAYTGSAYNWYYD